MVADVYLPQMSYFPQEACLHPFLLQEALPDYLCPGPARLSSDPLKGSLAVRHSLPGMVNSLPCSLAHLPVCLSRGPCFNEGFSL